MFSFTLALLILSILTVTQCAIFGMESRKRCWSSGNGLPAKWWQQGDRIDRGKYWYTCMQGTLKPEGCFSAKQERLPIGGRYVHSGYELECYMDTDGYLKVKFTACVPSSGKHYKLGETWEDDQHMYWFECREDGPYLKVEIRGCLTHDKTRRIALGEQYDKGDYTYKCMMKYNGTVQMCSVGCVHNGNHYKIGDQWVEGEYVYYCKLDHGRCQKICVGCNYNDKRLYDGDRYRKGDTVFQCEVRPDQYGHKPVACVVRDENGDTVERIVGCTWYQKTKTSKLEQICVLENGKAVVKTNGCIFVYKGFDTLFLLPNTYTIWNQQVDKKPIGVICRDGQGGDPSMETFNVEDIAFKTVGLKYNQPQG